MKLPPLGMNLLYGENKHLVPRLPKVILMSQFVISSLVNAFN